MNKSQAIYEIALSKIKGIGIKNASYILSKTDLKSFFKDSISINHEKTGLSYSFLKKINFKKALELAEKELNELIKKKCHFSFFNNQDYPNRLKHCTDKPIILYHKGISDFNAKKIVAIVGTRKASNEGCFLTKDLISKLSEQKITIVSGLAYGIDIAAHKACLEFNTPTFAVLGHGFDYVYPAYHKKEVEKIIDSGRIFSEHPPNVAPTKFFFAKRNRIIAGLADATIVMESDLKGGAMITANLANDYQKDVFAFPGNVFSSCSKGCNKLIQENKAHLITNADDFLRFMDWEQQKIPLSYSIKNELSKDETEVYNIILRNKIISINEICNITPIKESIINSILIVLELKGLVKAIPGKKIILN